MTSPGWYNNKQKLTEGNVYSFQFVKLVNLSDGEDYMVLEDPYGIRHMIAYACYRNYNIHQGSDIQCRVDKINCTGRIFLEPEHPYYKIGSKDNFDLLRIEKRPQNGKMDCFIVQDVFGNEVILEVNNDIPDNFQYGQISCLVESIKKGVPVLKFLEAVIN